MTTPATASILRLTHLASFMTPVAADLCQPSTQKKKNNLKGEVQFITESSVWLLQSAKVWIGAKASYCADSEVEKFEMWFWKSWHKCDYCHTGIRFVVFRKINIKSINPDGWWWLKMPPNFRFLSHLGKQCFRSEIEAVGLRLWFAFA